MLFKYRTGLFGNCKKIHLKFNHKDESIHYLPFSISYYSPRVHKVQNSQRNNIFMYLLFYILLKKKSKKEARWRKQGGAKNLDTGRASVAELEPKFLAGSGHF